MAEAFIGEQIRVSGDENDQSRQRVGFYIFEDIEGIETGHDDIANHQVVVFVGK
jgi:hypothetical protein